MARTDLEQLVYQMSADIRSLERANKRALGEVKDSSRKIQREYDQLAADMGRGFGRASLAAGVAFGAIVGYATKAASDAAETANAFQVAFGSLTPLAQKFAKSYSDTVGRSLVETQAQMAKTQLVLTGIGVSAEQALSLTESIQRRSVDIGSLWNVQDAEAYQAILSGIAGEAEPLKKFGVALNDAALKSELLRLGFKGNAQEAPEAAKAIARLNIIMRGTASADGDAIRTKDGLANKTKAARAEFEKAAVSLGENFLPIAAEAASVAADLLAEFNKWPDSMKLAGLAALGLVAAGGPIAALIDGWGKVIKFANAARAAQVAAAGVGGAAAAGGAAAKGAAAGGVGATLLGGGLAAAGVAYAALGIKGTVDAISGGDRVTLVNNLLKNPALVRGLKDEDIAKLQGQLRKDASRKGEFAQTMYGDFGVDTTPAKRALGILAGEANARKDIAAKAAGGGGSPDGGFTLPPDLQKPVADPNKDKQQAEAAAKLAKDQADRFNSAMARAKDDELRAQQSAAMSIQERAKNELQRIDDDEKARAVDLQLAIDKKELTEAQVKEIKAAEGKARSAERGQVTAERDEALKLESYRVAQDLASLEQDALSSQAEITRNIFERYQIERNLLALRQKQEREAQEEEIRRNPNLSPDEKKRLREDLAKAQAGAREVLAKTQREDLKSAILGAFDAAKGGAGSLAAYFGQQLKARLLDNAADALAKWLLNSGGGDGKGVVGKVGTFVKSFAGMFAGGGTIPTGQWGIVNDGAMEAVRAKPGGGIEVMNGGALRSLSGLSTQAASRVVVQDRVVRIVTEASPYFDTRVAAVSAPGAVQAGQVASDAGAAKATAAARSSSRYRIGR
jgi:hypothetical protein